MSREENRPRRIAAAVESGPGAERRVGSAGHASAEGVTETESGMVTSEIALGLIPISIVMLILMLVMAYVSAFMQAQDLSRSLGRSIAVGKPMGTRIAQIQESADAHIAVARDGDYVVVTVNMEPSGILSPFDVTASSTTAVLVEPGVELP